MKYVLSILMFCYSLVAMSQKEIKDFSLLNVDGTQVKLSDYKDAKGIVIIFTCNHCPFAKLYPSRLNALHKTYLPLGIPVIAISSTDTIQYEEDTYVLMQQKAKEEAFLFPYLYDGSQMVAKQFGAQKTPHAYVLWKQKGKWVVKYQGAIDDNGAEPEKVTQPFVQLALESLLNHRAIQIPSTKSIGCQIYFRK